MWDLLAFWPRLAHPICPPPYGGRATLELVERARFLGGAEEIERVVVLSGHSQGSLICAAAIAVLEKEAQAEQANGQDGPATRTLKRLCLVTYGSQLQWAYPRLFPSYIGFGRLQALYRGPLKTRWRNLYRWTDPLGGPVLAWPLDTLPTPSTSHWATMSEPHKATETAQRLNTDQHHRIGHDVRLLDPERVTRTQGNRCLPPLRGHGDYYADPVFEAVVTDVALAAQPDILFAPNSSPAVAVTEEAPPAR